jgi:hypothetical protein
MKEIELASKKDLMPVENTPEVQEQEFIDQAEQDAINKAAGRGLQ